MTRFGGMGRTRPKKLTSKAIVPIYKENQVEAIDNEVQNTLQAIETGVEKAEETVSVVVVKLCITVCCISRDRLSLGTTWPGKHRP
jgi:hypothetical protein